MKNSIHKLALKLGNNPALALKKIIQGGLVLLFGVLIVMTADRVIAESIIQEIIALLGLIIAGAGALWALVGYLSMSVFRIYHIIKKKD
ncbi:hypothetical protein MUS1_14050 [Marinomonas ushuaiensis DSM 15871]|uniref:Uncharacterized protein n=1 Tax=Marinomonas ushuaiensis DSM 15871 TaxID=1122207 RepID=X7E6A6_9GAMM|nr:hypothetical protein [Marinomonas ushuaiensis]ETX10703.1 hypothetical protein MUS1_14050 [Marinomonas ushuaiensis DSM 15871]